MIFLWFSWICMHFGGWVSKERWRTYEAKWGALRDKCIIPRGAWKCLSEVA